MSVILMPEAFSAEKRNKIAAEINSVNFCGLKINFKLPPHQIEFKFPPIRQYITNMVFHSNKFLL